MLFSIIIMVLINIYWMYNRRLDDQRSFYFAVLFIMAYGVLYFLVPPVVFAQQNRVALFYEFLPTLAFAAILFPELNHKLAKDTTRFIGWICLCLISLVLCSSKFSHG